MPAFNIPQFADLDFCSVCGGYDTIQTYIPLERKDRVDVYFHVCDKCFATKTVEELQSIMRKKRVG